MVPPEELNVRSAGAGGVEVGAPGELVVGAALAVALGPALPAGCALSRAGEMPSPVSGPVVTRLAASGSVVFAPMAGASGLGSKKELTSITMPALSPSKTAAPMAIFHVRSRSPGWRAGSGTSASRRRLWSGVEDRGRWAVSASATAGTSGSGPRTRRRGASASHPRHPLLPPGRPSKPARLNDLTPATATPPNLGEDLSR